MAETRPSIVAAERAPETVGEVSWKDMDAESPFKDVGGTEGGIFSNLGNLGSIQDLEKSGRMGWSAIHVHA